MDKLLEIEEEVLTSIFKRLKNKQPSVIALLIALTKTTIKVKFKYKLSNKDLLELFESLHDKLEQLIRL